MKNIFKLGLALLMILSISGVQAQGKMKIGHINSAELLEMMPERDSAEKALQLFAEQLDKDLQEMQAEIELKNQNFQAQQNDMIEIVKQRKMQELQNMYANFQAFQQTAQQDIMNKQQALLNPILEKAQNAIQEVAKENGFSYILDTSNGTVLFFENGVDIMDLVKKKLNLQ